MRASKTPVQWHGKWVAGMTGYNQRFGYQQSLISLYRVGEAYGFQAELVHALRQTSRAAVVDAKDASAQTWRLMVPLEVGIPANPHDPAAYKMPCLPHAHRNTGEDEGWKNDIHYAGRSPREPAMLVGHAEFSFRWTRPLIKRRQPAGFRMHRLWSLIEFLDDIEGVSA